MWKRYLESELQDTFLQVSEELNSVETIFVFQWHVPFPQVSEELNSVETETGTKLIEAFVSVSEELNSVETGIRPVVERFMEQSFRRT